MWGEAAAAGAHHLLTEVPAGADEVVLEHPAGGHGLGPAAVWLQQLAQELLRQGVALRVDHLPAGGQEGSGHTTFTLMMSVGHYSLITVLYSQLQ